MNLEGLLKKEKCPELFTFCLKHPPRIWNHKNCVTSRRFDVLEFHYVEKSIFPTKKMLHRKVACLRKLTMVYLQHKCRGFSSVYLFTINSVNDVKCIKLFVGLNSCV